VKCSVYACLLIRYCSILRLNAGPTHVSVTKLLGEKHDPGECLAYYIIRTSDIVRSGEVCNSAGRYRSSRVAAELSGYHRVVLPDSQSRHLFARIFWFSAASTCSSSLLIPKEDTTRPQGFRLPCFRLRNILSIMLTRLANDAWGSH
jgi:hypothetical protein